MSIDLAIIIPTYNVAGYIGATLDSIAAQEVQPAQIIVVDDGSTDNTVDVIRKHKLAGQVELVQQQNQGQGIARNTGIERAKTEYLYFLDSDDLVTPNFIISLKLRIEASNKPDVILFSGESFEDDDYSGGSFNPQHYLRPFTGNFASQKEFFGALLAFPELSCSPCLYVSKQCLWEQHNLAFNQFFHEDEELFYRLLFASNSFAVSTEVLFLRRLRNASTMTSHKTMKHANGMHALITSLLNMIDANSDDKLRVMLLRKRLRRFIASYILTCKAAGQAIDRSLVWSAATQIRHPRGHLSILRAMIMR
ncbi:glycosyltransferase family 2 protein [Pseudidiomarina salilacus]|uniref:glycosyltransferase family 2 protein n=1 Tax=Pseudidiomarina salilacus TaxID=3384452 RepID=UPI0039853E3C